MTSPRVRAAAARALGTIGEQADIETVSALLRDGEIDVRRAAQHGMDAIRARGGQAR